MLLGQTSNSSPQLCGSITNNSDQPILNVLVVFSNGLNWTGWIVGRLLSHALIFYSAKWLTAVDRTCGQPLLFGAYTEFGTDVLSYHMLVSRMRRNEPFENFRAYVVQGLEAILPAHLLMHWMNSLLDQGSFSGKIFRHSSNPSSNKQSRLLRSFWVITMG